MRRLIRPVLVTAVCLAALPARAGNPAITRFDTSCFTGDYVTGDVSADYLEHISAMRSDSARQARETDDDTVIDLSNHA